MKIDKWHGQYVWATVSGVRLHMPGSLGEYELAGQRDFRYLGVTQTPEAILSQEFSELTPKHMYRTLHGMPPFESPPVSFPLLLLVAITYLVAAYFWRTGKVTQALPLET